MKVLQGVPQGGTAAVDLDRTWNLTGSNSGDGRRYQLRFALQLPTGGVAEDVVLDASTGLRLKALAHSFNALDAQSPEPAQVSPAGDGTGLLISLPLARLISGIRFRSGVGAGGKTTQLFRIDGDAIADDAVASWPSLDYPFAKGAGEKMAWKTGGTRSKAGGKMATSNTPHGIAVEDHGLSSIDLAHQVAVEAQGVLDSRIVVRLLGASGFTALVSADLTEVTLAAGPENLRLGIGLPALGPEVFFLPLRFESGVQVDAGVELRKQLEDLIQRLRGKLADAGAEAVPVLPDPLAIELVVESDAPCRFSISQFAIGYQLARQSFPDGSPKQVLRFPKGQLARRRIDLQVPTAVTVTSAMLTLAGDGSASPAETSGTPATGQLSATLGAAGASGVRLEGVGRWASPVELSEPILCEGWDLLLAGLAADTRLRFELIADLDGRPDGDVLAQAEEALKRPERRRLLRFRFREPVLLPAGGYWLAVESVEGAAVWFLDSAPGRAILRLRQRGWEGVASVADQAGIGVPVAAGGESSKQRRYPEISLGGMALPLISGDPDWVYELGPALAASNLAGSGLVGLALEVLAAGAKPVIAYPPRIQFDL
jgi:hypothetical protein